MNRNRMHIVIIDHSPIIYEGLCALLTQSDMDCCIKRMNSLDNLEAFLHLKEVDVLIVNPILLVNRETEVKKIRKNHPSFSIVGVSSSIIDSHVVALLDESFTIFDSTEQILSKLQKVCSSNTNNNTPNDNNLTERELDVLIHVVHGYTNKEIADKLHISVHTVATHRKNIAAKTGIRSESGLAIYAISKRIISIDDVDLSNNI